MPSPIPGPPHADALLDLATAGWSRTWQDALTATAAGAAPARVLCHHRTAYQLLTAAGACTGIAAGALRDLPPGLGHPAVGDWVAVDPLTHDPCRILAVLPRRSCVSRVAAGTQPYHQVLAANIDLVLITIGLDRDFNLRRLERYLLLITGSGAEAMVVLSKCDLVADPAPALAACAGISDVRMLAVSAHRGDGMAALATAIGPAGTVAVLGSSGAGKSSLINALSGGTLQDTGDVRAVDGRGRHTTTARVLLPLPGGGVILDTPGMRELRLAVDGDAAACGFADIAEHAALCRFADCSHQHEPGCEVQLAIGRGDLDAGRLSSYGKLLRESARQLRKSAYQERRQLRRTRGGRLLDDE
jgi:ribosome biogenesis GTPase